jgi:hypothetical protein
MSISKEEAARMFAAYRERIRAWESAGRPMTPEQQRRAEDHLERTAVELGGPIPARFKDLQYINKAQGQR